MQKEESPSEPLWTDILLRDSLTDNGTVPSVDNPWWFSPDVICTQLHQGDPTPYTQQYDLDSNLPVIQYQNNFVYVRGKNLGIEKAGGKIYLYWMKATLFAHPNQWLSNVVKANIQGSMQPYNTLPETDTNTVSVTQVPFVWNPPSIDPNDHYCLLAAVSTIAHPFIPEEVPQFPSMDEAVAWLRSNRNICLRNVTLETSATKPVLERLDLVYSSSEKPVPLLIKIVCSKVPYGTTLLVSSERLGINMSCTTTLENQTIYSEGVECPSHYQGYVDTRAYLPSGATWPEGGSITVTLFYAFCSTGPAARFAHHFNVGELPLSAQQALNLFKDNTQGVWVAAGSCSTVIKTK